MFPQVSEAPFGVKHEYCAFMRTVSSLARISHQETVVAHVRRTCLDSKPLKVREIDRRVAQSSDYARTLYH